MKSRWKWAITATFFVFLCTGTLAQNVGITASYGIASQRMDDLKYLQQYILSTYPVEGKITSSFPPFTSFSLNVVKEWYDYLYLGGGYTFSTTGGKSSYSDYTGSIGTEMDVTSHRLGAVLSYIIVERDRLDLALFGRLDANLSTVQIESGINILGLINRIFNEYRSFSPSGTAGIELMFKFRGFAVGAEGSYLVDLPGRLVNTETKDDLTDPYDRNRILTTDWTGWRAGIKVRVWMGN